MALQCNIDAKGKAVRLWLGLAELAVGVLLMATWAWPGGGWLAWGASALLMAMGAFSVFEGRSGWCIVRAMGFKTPM